MPADRLARARRLLEAGQVEAARAEVERLPGATQASNWMDAARRYIVARKALDILDFHPARLAVTDEVADCLLGGGNIKHAAGERGMRQKPVDRAFKIAPVRGDHPGDIGDDIRRHFEGWKMRFCHLNAAFQNLDAQRIVECADFDDKTASEPRLNALFKAFKIGRCPVCRDNHLLAGIDQGIERVAEFLLALWSVQELRIVDDEDVDTAQVFLEGNRGLRFQRGDKAIHETLGRKIQHTPPGGFDDLSRSLKKVGLAEADAGMDEQRVEHRHVVRLGLNDLHRGSMRFLRPVGRADRVGGR